MQNNKRETKLITKSKCVAEEDNMKPNKNGIRNIILSIGLMMILIVVIYISFHHSYNGVWEMKGYGLALKIQNGFVKTYEVTESYYCQESKYDGFVFRETFFQAWVNFC